MFAGLRTFTHCSRGRSVQTLPCLDNRGHLVGPRPLFYHPLFHIDRLYSFTILARFSHTKRDFRGLVQSRFKINLVEYVKLQSLNYETCRDISKRRLPE